MLGGLFFWRDSDLQPLRRCPDSPHPAGLGGRVGWPRWHRNRIILWVDGWGLRRDDNTVGDGVNLVLAV